MASSPVVQRIPATVLMLYDREREPASLDTKAADSLSAMKQLAPNCKYKTRNIRRGVAIDIEEISTGRLDNLLSAKHRNGRYFFQLADTVGPPKRNLTPDKSPSKRTRIEKSTSPKNAITRPGSPKPEDARPTSKEPEATNTKKVNPEPQKETLLTLVQDTASRSPVLPADNIRKAGAPRTNRHSTRRIRNLQVPPAAVASFETYIFRPPTGLSITAIPTKDLQHALNALGPVTEYRPVRNGGIAVDFKRDVADSLVMKCTALTTVPVTVSRPYGHGSCFGVINDVDISIDLTEFQQEATSSAPIQAAVRMAKPGVQTTLVKVTFQGSGIPDRILYAFRSYKVRQYRPSPQQCSRCARFGHAASRCSAKPRCLECAGPHLAEDCPKDNEPTCANCKASHPASDKFCSSRAFHVKVKETQLAHRIPYNQAMTAVKTHLSYAEATRCSLQDPAPVPASQPILGLPRKLTDLPALAAALMKACAAAIMLNNLDDLPAAISSALSQFAAK